MKTPKHFIQTSLLKLLLGTDICPGGFAWEPQCYGGWKGYHKGMFDDDGKPTNSFNAFKR